MRVLLLLLLAGLSFAHLATGVDKEVGPYLLDVGWDPYPPVAGEPAFFAINIVENGTFEKTDYTEAWVRFSKGDRISYAGAMALEEGSTSFSYEFPEGGEWDMDIRFGNYSGKVGLDVGEKNPDNPGLGWIAAGFFAILALAAVIWGRSRRK